jgi:hypothetical protein
MFVIRKYEYTLYAEYAINEGIICNINLISKNEPNFTHHEILICHLNAKFA